MITQDERIIYLYCITCLVNNKVYIGQTVDCGGRWRAHRRDSAEPKVPIQFAIKKHGALNFIFEVIATCKGIDNANELETILVAQYDSYVNNNKGYNATHGGQNAPKTEEWRQKMRDWHASMSEEDKTIRRERARKVMTRFLKEKGHPFLGKRCSEEERAKRSYAQRHNRKNNYTPEMRQMFSEVQKTRFATEVTRPETIEKRRIATAETVRLRQEQEMQAGTLRCQAPGCDFAGVSEFYVRVNDLRYCPLHGRRLKQYGSFDKPPHSCIGKKPANTHKFTEEQVLSIVNDPRGSYTVCRDYNVTGKVIIRVRKENAHLKCAS